MYRILKGNLRKESCTLVNKKTPLLSYQFLSKNSGANKAMIALIAFKAFLFKKILLKQKIRKQWILEGKETF
jgi:hypothetical protein